MNININMNMNINIHIYIYIHIYTHVHTVHAVHMYVYIYIHIVIILLKHSNLTVCFQFWVCLLTKSHIRLPALREHSLLRGCVSSRFQNWRSGEGAELENTGAYWLSVQHYPAESKLVSVSARLCSVTTISYQQTNTRSPNLQLIP